MTRGGSKYVPVRVGNRFDMLSNVMEKARSAAGDAPLPTTPPGCWVRANGVYPDKLDAPLLRISGVCLLATIMAILDVTVVTVAQRTFITEFDSDQAVVAWTMTGYTLGLATVIPLTGWAADRFGTKRIFMGSVVAFVLVSQLCAAASNILQLIVFRVVQGVSGGMLMPLGFVIMTREAGPGRLGRLMSILSIPMLLAPIAGPILGGLADRYLQMAVDLFDQPSDRIGDAGPGRHRVPQGPTRSETFDVVGAVLLSPDWRRSCSRCRPSRAAARSPIGGWCCRRPSAYC